MSGALSIQTALFAALRADSTLNGLLARDSQDAAQPAIYDNVPQESAYPYVTVGDETELPWDTDDTVGREGTQAFHVWSRYRGRKEVKLIMDAIKGVLHNKPLTVSGETVILVLFEFSDIITDPDGITIHGTTRYRVISTGT